MPYSTEQTAYTFFGVSSTASPFEIQQAYDRAIRRYPPDRVWDRPMASVSKTGQQDAERWYAKISTPDARQAYDAMLAEKNKKNKLDLSFAVKAGPSMVKEMSEPETEPEGESIGEQDTIQDSRHDGEDDGDSGDDDDKKDSTPPPNKSTPITLASLDNATGSPYLYRSRTRTLCALAILWLGILIIVYGTPSTWPLYTQIRAAYHRAVLSHHPDKCGGDANNIIEVTTAYETLSEPYSRCLYERAGLVQAWACAHLKAEEEVDVEAGVEKEPAAGSVGRPQTGQVAVFTSLHNLWQRVWHRLAKWLVRVAGCL
ncbi:hypothetical protein Sste5344_007756 [Sporothrix stenoceras]